jgi:hypothetical protein
MLNIQTWDRTSAWDPTNPNQQPDQFWSAADMGYRSAYWNEQPTTVQSLAGIFPTRTGPRITLAVVAGFAGYLAYKNYKRSGSPIGGTKRRRHRR